MIGMIRNFILRDFWLKLCSLVLGIFIWLTVWFVRKGEVPSFLTSDAPTQKYYNIPVLVMSSAAEVRSFKVEPSVITVTVRGDKKSLEKLQLKPSEIQAVVDLTLIEAAARGVRKRIVVTTPPGTSPVQIDPNDVEVIVPPIR